MSEIISNHNIGDKVFILRNHKIKEVEITNIIANQDGVSYSFEKKSSIIYPVKEELCFRSAELLIEYLLES